MSLGQRHIKDQKVQQELFRDSSFLAVELPHFQTQSLWCFNSNIPPTTNSFSYFAHLDLWQLKAKSAEKQPEVACVCALLASQAQPVLAPNLFNDNYELKTLVMDRLCLLQIWDFSFKGMLERTGECLQHPGSYQDSSTAPFHLPGRKGSEMAPQTIEDCLTLPPPSTTTLQRISASLGQ